MKASSNDPAMEVLSRLADLPQAALVSEEDVKNKVILPWLRALGYDDSDFNYERRTGRGYVDVVVERFPCGIAVEAKAPKTRLDQCIPQLETYVFHKHGQDRTTIAILTDGESFNLYGVTGALWKGGLEKYLILSFKRQYLTNPPLQCDLRSLLGRESNATGAIADAIKSYKERQQDHLDKIRAELSSLKEQRDKIEARIHVADHDV